MTLEEQVASLQARVDVLERFLASYVKSELGIQAMPLFMGLDFINRFEHAKPPQKESV